MSNQMGKILRDKKALQTPNDHNLVSVFMT